MTSRMLNVSVGMAKFAYAAPWDTGFASPALLLNFWSSCLNALQMVAQRRNGLEKRGEGVLHDLGLVPLDAAIVWLAAIVADIEPSGHVGGKRCNTVVLRAPSVSTRDTTVHGQETFSQKIKHELSHSS